MFRFKIIVLLWIVSGSLIGGEVFAQLSSCANADFEQNSFANWTGTTGFCCPINSITPGIVNGRHTIMTGPGTDPNTNGAITVVAPGGTFSARLGNDQVGGEAEQLSYQIQVDASNALFIYRYAVVLEDPSHSPQEQPRFEIRVYDANGNPVGCGTYNVYASAGIPGFQTITNQFGSTIHYKDWTTVGIDLSPYIGQTVTIEFSTGDCALGGHFGYAYVDCYCSPLQIFSDFCDGSTSTILTAPVGFAAYLWNTGETTQSITVQNAVVGTQYTCTMTSVTGCTITLTAILTPTVIASGFFEGEACQNRVEYFDSSFVVAGTPINAWLWDFGDGNTSVLQNPIHQYAAPGTYPVQLIVQNMGGCRDTILQSVTIVPIPVGGFLDASVCPGQPGAFTDLSTSLNGPIVQWSWNFGDGSPADTLQHPAHVYQLPGSYPVSLIVTDSIGCRDTVSMAVNTLPAPVAGFSYVSACVSSQIGFTDTSLVTSSPVTAWEWDFGDGSPVVSGVASTSHVYPSSGSYTASLIVTTQNGCVDTVVNPIVVQTVPVASFTANQPCTGQFTQFTDGSGMAVGTVVSWQWQFGDGNSSTGVQHPVHTYAAAGNYSVQLVVTGSNGCTDTTVQAVIVLPAPVAGFSYTPVCPGEPSQFSDNTSFPSGSIQSWSWNFGDGSPLAGGASPLHTYSAGGSYDVVLVVTGNNGCADSVQVNVSTVPVPQPGFFIPSGCEDAPVYFPNLSTISTGSIGVYIWDFGDGSTDSLQSSPSHAYTSPGTYFVTLTAVSGLGCRASVTNEVTVFPLPAAAFSVSPVCPGDTSVFSDLSQSASPLVDWIWTFGDGTSSNPGVQQPVHIYGGAGSYPVQLVVMNANGCLDTVTGQAIVKPQPVPDFSGIGPYCAGQGFSVSNLSAVPGGFISSSQWLENGVLLSIQTNPVLNFTQPGLHPVTLIINGSNGCVDSVTKNITVHALPVPSVVVSDACMLIPVLFTANATGPAPVTAWNWNADNGTTSVQPSFTTTYPQQGAYYPYLEVTDSNGCKGDTIVRLDIWPEPVAAFIVPDGCPGEVILFEDASALASPDTLSSWSWDFGDASPLSFLQDPQHTYAVSGTYPVTLIAVSQHGCRDTTNDVITIFPLPVIRFSADTVCEGTPTSFVNQSVISSGSISSWNWDFGDGTAGNNNSPAHVYPDGGSYAAQLTATSDQGCVDSLTRTVRVWYAPEPYFIADDTAGCEDHSLIFSDLSVSADGGIYSRQWTFGNGDSSQIQQPSYTYTEAGIYDVNLLVTSDYGCVSDTTRFGYIEVYGLPLAAFSYNPDRPSVFMPEVYFYDQSVGATQWWWNFGDSATAEEMNPSHIYQTPGFYTVTLMVETPQGCRDTAWKVLEVEKDYALWIPNAFTPNNDGVNDDFLVKGFGFSAFSMLIFDRWGEQIFSSADEARGWDGSYNGAPAQTGVYVYQIEMRDVFGQPHVYNGRITLVR